MNDEARGDPWYLYDLTHTIKKWFDQSSLIAQ